MRPGQGSRGQTPERRAAARWAGRGLLVLGVVLVHGWVLDRAAESSLGWGAVERPPPRIEVAFVRELAQAAPPPAAPPRAVARKRRLPAVARAASAPASAAEAVEPPTPELVQPRFALPEERATAADFMPPAEPAPVAAAPAAASAPMPALAAAASLPASAAQAPAAAANAASAPGFDWPPSTRLSFHLTGNYRGPLDGSAQVEWLRSGQRYQVHLETSIGPVLSRHITSEGELGDQGLVPRRFDGEQRVLFRGTRRWSLRFGPERIVLADGREVDTLPGAQDEASQFVQLTWLFINRPELLKVGASVELPLAISRKLEPWIYDVVGTELLYFPFGQVPTFHLKPRREASGGDLSAEIWIAPTLQYLPVRILIRQNPQTWVDLKLQKPPLQAAAPASR